MRDQLHLLRIHRMATPRSGDDRALDRSTDGTVTDASGTDLAVYAFSVGAGSAVATVGVDVDVDVSTSNVVA